MNEVCTCMQVMHEQAYTLVKKCCELQQKCKAYVYVGFALKRQTQKQLELLYFACERFAEQDKPLEETVSETFSSLINSNTPQRLERYLPEDNLQVVCNKSDYAKVWERYHTIKKKFEEFTTRYPQVSCFIHIAGGPKGEAYSNASLQSLLTSEHWLATINLTTNQLLTGKRTAPEFSPNTLERRCKRLKSNVAVGNRSVAKVKKACCQALPDTEVPDNASIISEVKVSNSDFQMFKQRMALDIFTYLVPLEDKKFAMPDLSHRTNRLAYNRPVQVKLIHIFSCRLLSTSKLKYAFCGSIWW